MRKREKKTDPILRGKPAFLVYIAAMLVAAFGGALIYLSGLEKFCAENGPVATVIRSLGLSLLTTVAIGLIWQLFVRKAFLEELLHIFRVADEVTSAGIIGFIERFYELEWASYFSGANTLDIFFAFGRTWRGANKQNLQEFVRKGGQIRIVLPDPNDNLTMAELARRFNFTQDELIKRVRDALGDFQSLQSERDDAKIAIWLLTKAPLFTFYRFDSTVILTLYNHRPGRVPIPIFIAKRGGKLFDFVMSEFDAMICANGLAKPFTLK